MSQICNFTFFSWLGNWSENLFYLNDNYYLGPVHWLRVGRPSLVDGGFDARHRVRNLHDGKEKKCSSKRGPIGSEDKFEKGHSNLLWTLAKKKKGKAKRQIVNWIVSINSNAANNRFFFRSIFEAYAVENKPLLTSISIYIL